MEPTTQETLREALLMIEDTRDYLKRLPPVPVTYDFIAKLSQFLDQPSNRLLLLRNVPRRGAFRLAAGVPLLNAELRGDRLQLVAPVHSHPNWKAPPIPLHAGITIQLVPEGDCAALSSRRKDGPR